MENNKLTEFDKEKFELDVLRLISKHTDTGGCFYHSDFLADLRQIMPPICTPNERKFLDEIEKGWYKIHFKIPHTSELTTMECEAFLEDVRRHCQEFHGLRVPLPNEVIYE
jgi:hypothetical protein